MRTITYNCLERYASFFDCPQLCKKTSLHVSASITSHIRELGGSNQDIDCSTKYQLIYVYFCENFAFPEIW